MSPVLAVVVSVASYVATLCLGIWYGLRWHRKDTNACDDEWIDLIRSEIRVAWQAGWQAGYDAAAAELLNQITIAAPPEMN